MIAFLNQNFFEKKPFWMPNKLYTAVCERSNPRSEESLTEILHTYHPGTKIVKSLPDSPKNKEIILLYRDSIGLGMAPSEIMLLLKGHSVTVVTGRKRMFTLTWTKALRLWAKRVLEKTFIIELILMPFILIVGTMLAIYDLITGRK